MCTRPHPLILSTYTRPLPHILSTYTRPPHYIPHPHISSLCTRPLPHVHMHQTTPPYLVHTLIICHTTPDTPSYSAPDYSPHNLVHMHQLYHSLISRPSAPDHSLISCPHAPDHSLVSHPSAPDHSLISCPHAYAPSSSLCSKLWPGWKIEQVQSPLWR